MRPNEVPGGDQPVRGEVLHQSKRAREPAIRGRARGDPQGAAGTGCAAATAARAAMLKRLRNVVGVAQLLDEPRYRGSLVMADVGGTSLADIAKPLAVDELIGLAVQLAGAVAGMHRRGVMHRDITPANIVVSRDGAPCLVDFTLATSFAEIRPEFTHTVRSWGRWSIWRPSRPDGPAGRWISVPTSTRWAARFSSWRPASRRSGPGIRCGSPMTIWLACRCRRRS